ncbi:MAG: FMN-binding negative transcriptional regulator [Alphaproteobacteria bacterium]|nr:FMN-binding negative transcriptional regulator [Alphaproteobacteria bacterium]
MYVPRHFQETDVPTLHAAIRDIAFGTLVSAGPDGMIASHVPMIIDPEPAPYGTLLGHVARANPHGQVTSAFDALAMFVGPNSYVTPSYYAAKREHGKVVPTWNYVAVHAYGKLEWFDDAERLLGVVTRLTDTHEGKRADVWKVTDAPADFVAGMLKGIIGFALPIARLEGKWKMSQNRPAADRPGVIEGLQRDDHGAVADLVAARTR